MEEIMNIPKRRKSKDNPYTLKIIDNTYFVIFKDGLDSYREVAISEDIFNAMNTFELEDISQMHKIDRHMEKSEIYEDNLNKRAFNKPLLLEDEFIKKTAFDDLKNAINKLPEVQRRRIKKYYFDDKSQVDIAKEENTTKVAVNQSLKKALLNLKKILKNS